MRRLVALALMLASSTAAAQPPEPTAAPGVAASSAIPGLALAPDLAFADPVDVNPGSGRRKLIAGWLSLGLTAGNVAFASALCEARNKGRLLPASGSTQTCTRTSIAFASITFLIGVPLLVAGYRQRARYHAWRERHGLLGLAGLSLDVSGDAKQPSPWLTYRASF